MRNINLLTRKQQNLELTIVRPTGETEITSAASSIVNLSDRMISQIVARQKELGNGDVIKCELKTVIVANVNQVV